MHRRLAPSSPAGRPLGALVVLLLAAVAALLPGAAALAGPAQSTVVSAVPASGTPDIHDGAVFAAAQVGGVMVVGGTFTSIDLAGGGTRSTPYVLAFDATSGALQTSFAPGLDGEVDALLPGPTAGTVYVGGAFRTVGGAPAKGLVLLDVATGARVGSFALPNPDGTVQTVKLAHGHLLIGGTFTTIGGAPRGGLASVDPSTGTLDGYLTSSVAVNHNWTPSSPPRAAKAPVGVFRLAVTPDGSTMVGIGNFKQVDGASHDQIAMWTLPASGPATLRDWGTTALSPPCLAVTYDSYVRDVDFSPDGSYFALVNTGGYKEGALCDSASRWETSATGQSVQPTWVDYTGQDSLLSTAVTGTAVYVGGHERWLNNGLAHDSAGPGAVPRPGLAALDPANGLPMAWNPGRNPRGAGAYTLLATPQGLWMGSDTSYIGNRTYLRGRIALFPLAGGAPAAPKAVPGLPGEVYQGTVPAAPPSGVLLRIDAAGPLLRSTDAGPDWLADTAASSAYHGSGSTAVAYGTPVPALDGTVPVGTPRAVFSSERVDPGAKGDGGEMQWHLPVAQGTAVDLRLYFAARCTCAATTGKRVFDVAVDGTTRLSQFDPVAAAGVGTGTMVSLPVTSDGSIDVTFGHEVGDPAVSALEVVASGTGATPSPTGTLTGRTFAGSTPGAATPLSSPLPVSGVRGAMYVGSTLYYGKTDSQLYARSTDGRTWGPETAVDPYDDPYWSDVKTGSGGTVYRGTRPSFYDEITNLTSMWFDGVGRVYYTLYGQRALYWRDFTPDSGIVGYARHQVAGLTMPDVTGAFAAGGSMYYVTRADGNLSKVGFDGTRTTTPPAVVSGPATDGVDWRSSLLFLGPVPPAAGASVAFHGVSSLQRDTSSSLQVPVPAGTQRGDALLLKVSTSGTSSAPHVPAGWTQVASQVAGTSLTVLWSHVATTADLGSSVPVTLATSIKSSSQLLAYGGTATAPVSAVATAADGTATTQHAAPPVSVAQTGSWVVRLYSDKSSTTTAWTSTAGAVRQTSCGTGAGYLCSLLTDDGAAQPAGTAPAAIATTDAASRAATFSVVLAPAS